MKNRYTRAMVAALIALLVLSGCSSPEKKKLSFYDKGKAYYEQKDMVKSSLAFRNAIQIDPNYAEAYHMLAKVELANKEFKKAFGYFSKAIELNADLLDAYVERGKMLLQAKEVGMAEKDSRYVLDRQADHQGGRLLQAGVNLAEKKQEIARDQLKQLIAEGMTDPMAFQMLASIAFKAGDVEGGQQIMRDGMKANPEAVQLRVLMVAILVKDKKLDEAIAVVKEAIAIEPDQKAHQLKLAALYWELGRKDDVAALFAQMMAADENPIDMRILAADFYAKHKDMNKAKAVINEGIGQEEKSIVLRLALARLQMADREHDKAQRTLEAASGLTQDDADPDLLKAKNMLARLHLGKGEIDAAKKLTDEVIAVSANNADAQFGAGQIYLRRKDGLNAVTAFRTVVAEKPEFVAGHLHLAQGHLQNKEKNLAVDALTNGLKFNPSAAPLHKALARIYAADKDDTAAEKELRLIVEQNPKDLRARSDLADFLYSRDRKDEAIRIYEKMTDEHPKVPAGYSKLASIHHLQKDPGKATAILENGHKEIPQSAKILNQLVKSYMAEGKDKNAKDLLETRIVKNENDFLANNFLGEIHLYQKKYVAAENLFERAIALKPEWEVPQKNLVRAYLIQGKESEAIEKLNAVLDENPKNAGAYLTLGHLYNDGGNKDRAMEIYQKALGAIPNLWPAANNLAYMLSENSTQKSDLDRAQELALRAVKLQPERPDVIDTLGWVYYQRGETDLAIVELEKASKRAQDSVHISYHLAMALMRANRLEEARELLEKVVADEDFSERETAEKALAALKAG